MTVGTKPPGGTDANGHPYAAAELLELLRADPSIFLRDKDAEFGWDCVNASPKERSEALKRVMAFLGRIAARPEGRKVMEKVGSNLLRDFGT